MVDQANTTLGKMLLEQITPVVMVLSTSLVEEACRKNGLSFVQMLSPFCNFSNIDVPVRTASDQPYRLQKFKLRLFYASDIREPNIEVAKEHLKQVITQAGEKDLSELCSDPPEIDNIVNCSESEFLPSWFQLINEELIRTMSFSDHEAFDHPVACLIVVSSKDEQPINKFVDLFNTDQLPSILKDGAMDPKIPKQYMLVHDNQDGTSEKASKILTEMKSTFGANDCRLLCINSSQDSLVENQDNPWASHKTDASLCQHLGCFLNINDISEIKDIMQDLSSKGIIPYMEQKIRVLNQQVSATRKGFKNQIKNLWWRKGKEETVDTPNGPMYTFSSVESQIRVLGDYAFMLRDYELALSNYRLISTDYKIDKSWKRYAGVQEMMGLSYFMLDQSRKEAEYCMENAFSTYSKIGSSGQQNATRCGLWWVEMLKTRLQYKEAASVYFRISGEESVHSAVMLEQASYCYLFTKPPMLHKYGFHLVLSGDRYRKYDQIKHAIRTYRSAISVYKGTTWSHIKDHIHFHIGKWYAFLGVFDLAVTHMLEILVCSHQPKTTQEIFLRDFLRIVQETGKTFEVLRLQLPVINISTLKVVFEDHRTCASPAAVSVKESFWSSLEEDMIPSLSTTRSNWLQSQPTLKKYKESNICVAGEAIKVDIEFKNPLKISIFISSVSLICELSTQSDELESDSALSKKNDADSAPLQNVEESRKLTTTREQISNSSLFSLSEVDFSLEGDEKIVAFFVTSQQDNPLTSRASQSNQQIIGVFDLVQLTVTPKVEGVLKIVGVRWKLSGCVIGIHNFESNLAKKKVTKGRRKSKHSPSDYLKFIVIKTVPRLEGGINSIPSKVYAGDVRRLVLELRNLSEYSVKNLKMKISHPRFLSIGKHEYLNAEFPACLEKGNNSDRSSVQPEHDKLSHAIFMFPEDTSIQGGAPFLWPLWLRAAAPGNISLYISIYYEMGNASSIMKYRTLRMHYNLQVLPSMDVSFQISPCPSRLQEFLVRMDVVNRTDSECFQVHQLSCVGCQWEISLLQPVDRISPSLLLMAGQALSCFFKLKSGTSEANVSAISPLCGGDVRLCPQGSEEALFDVSSSPLSDFHQQERLHQGMSHQGHPGTVDLILISQPQKRDTDPGSPETSHLFSHHACNCSISSTSPIWWILDGPQTVHHNFSGSFSEITLTMTIHNSSEATATIRISTYDSNNSTTQSSDATAIQSGNEVGWHDVSDVLGTRVNDVEVKSDVLGIRAKKLPPPETLKNVSPFIWSGTSSTRVELGPMSTTEIPLQICVFSPGTYDLSNYVLHWNLPSSSNQGTRPTSGTCPGYPYYLTILQSA